MLALMQLCREDQANTERMKAAGCMSAAVGNHGSTLNWKVGRTLSGMQLVQ